LQAEWINKDWGAGAGLRSRSSQAMTTDDSGDRTVILSLLFQTPLIIIQLKCVYA
jgi:hypothetical protein